MAVGHSGFAFASWHRSKVAETEPFNEPAIAGGRVIAASVRVRVTCQYEPEACEAGDRYGRAKNIHPWCQKVSSTLNCCQPCPSLPPASQASNRLRACSPCSRMGLSLFRQLTQAP